MAKNRTIIKIRPFAPIDGVIIILTLGGICAALPLMQSVQPATVAVYRDNTLLARYPVGEDHAVTVDGADGSMIIRISGKSARIESSRCPRQVCMHAGGIKNAGEQIICAPNHVMVAIEGSSADTKEIDGIVR